MKEVSQCAFGAYPAAWHSSLTQWILVPAFLLGRRHCRDLPLNLATYGGAPLLQSEASWEVEEATRLKEKAENERAVLPDLYSLKGRPHLSEVRPCHTCASCFVLHCIHTLANCSLYYLHVHYEHIKYLLYVHTSAGEH